MEHENDSDTNCNWRTWNSPLKIGKGTGKLGNKRTIRDHLSYCQSTEKSPGDLRKLAVTQTPAGGKKLSLERNNNKSIFSFPFLPCLFLGSREMVRQSSFKTLIFFCSVVLMCGVSVSIILRFISV